MTFAVEYQFYGLKPGMSHFFNVLLYALMGLLLFKVLRLLIPGSSSKPWFSQLPFVASLLFTLHPVHSEVVANIKGRDEILALMLSLAALYFSVKATTSEKKRWLMISGGVFLLALLAKESAITFLAVIPLCLYFFSKISFREIVTVSLPLLVAVLVYVGIRHRVVGPVLERGEEVAGLMNNPFLGATISEKYATILHTLALYVKLLFFPHPLTHDYYPYHIPVITWADPRAWGSLLLYILLAGYALLNCRKKDVVAFGILYFLSTLSVVSNLVVPIGTFMNERFLFMPSVGFCIILGVWLSCKLPNLLKKNVRLARGRSLGLLAIVCVGFGVKTVTRIPAWKDTMSLNRAGAEVSTGSARANCFMGYALYDMACAIREDRTRQLQLYGEAEYYIDKALSIYPVYSTALNIKAGILGGYHQHDGNLDKLLDGFYEIIKVRHVPYVAGYLRYLNRQKQNIDKLVDFCHQAGFLLVAEEQKDYPLALEYLSYGLRLDPNNVQILVDLSKVYYAQDDHRKALEMAQRGLAISPNHTELNRQVRLAAKGVRK
ncbi:MAG: tetratricopeptide repeat protein [Planctomycetota bacterium]